MKKIPKRDASLCERKRDIRMFEGVEHVRIDPFLLGYTILFGSMVVSAFSNCEGFTHFYFLKERRYFVSVLFYDQDHVYYAVEQPDEMMLLAEEYLREGCGNVKQNQ